MKVKPTVWFARGGDIGRMGPYKSYEEASFALMGVDGFPVEGAFVWAEPKGYKPKRTSKPRTGPMAEMAMGILDNFRR